MFGKGVVRPNQPFLLGRKEVVRPGENILGTHGESV